MSTNVLISNWKNRTFSRYCYTEAIPLDLLCMLLDTCKSGVVCGQISLDKKDWEGRNVEQLRKSTYTQCVALFLGHFRFYLTAMEKIGIFHSCEINSGSGLETRLLYVQLAIFFCCIVLFQWCTNISKWFSTVVSKCEYSQASVVEWLLPPVEPEAQTPSVFQQV